MGDDLSGKQVEQMIEDMKSPKSGNGHFATFEEVKEKFAKISELIMDEEARKTSTLKGAVKSLYDAIRGNF